MKKRISVFLLAMFTALSSGVVTSLAAEDEKDLGVIVRVDFDGADEQKGYQFGYGATATEITGIKDGNLEINTTNFTADPEIRIKDWNNYGAWNSMTGKAIVIADYSKITVRTRFMVNGNKTEELNHISEIFALVDGHINSNLTVFAKNGKLAYGIAGNDMKATNAKVVTDFSLKKGTWYTLELYWNGAWHLNLISEDGDVYDGSASVVPGGFVNPDEIGRIKWWRFNAFDGVVDYVEVVNDGFRVKNSSIGNGSEDVPVYESCNISFSEAVNKESFSVFVTDSNEADIPAEIIAIDDDEAEICFPAGLKYDEEYKIILPATIKSESGSPMAKTEIAFTTEEKPYSVGELQYTSKENALDVSLNVTNKSGKEKKINILLVSYDNEQKIYSMKNEEIIIEGIFSGKKTVTIETEQSTPSKENVKAYIWDGVEIVSE